MCRRSEGQGEGKVRVMGEEGEKEKLEGRGMLGFNWNDGIRHYFTVIVQLVKMKCG